MRTRYIKKIANEIAVIIKTKSPFSIFYWLVYPFYPTTVFPLPLFDLAVWHLVFPVSVLLPVVPVSLVKTPVRPGVFPCSLLLVLYILAVI